MRTLLVALGLALLAPPAAAQRSDADKVLYASYCTGAIEAFIAHLLSTRTEMCKDQAACEHFDSVHRDLLVRRKRFMDYVLATAPSIDGGVRMAPIGKERGIVDWQACSSRPPGTDEPACQRFDRCLKADDLPF